MLDLAEVVAQELGTRPELALVAIPEPGTEWSSPQRPSGFSPRPSTTDAWWRSDRDVSRMNGFVKNCEPRRAEAIGSWL